MSSFDDWLTHEPPLSQEDAPQRSEECRNVEHGRCADGACGCDCHAERDGDA